MNTDRTAEPHIPSDQAHKPPSLLQRLRHHLLWNILPTLLVLAAVGWIALQLSEQIVKARNSGQAPLSAPATAPPTGPGELKG